MARNRYLTRQGFAAWLAAKGDDGVGRTRSINDCPIALYLEDLTKREWHASPLACVPQVDAEPGEDPFDLNHEFKTPRWAQRFIHTVDKQFGRKPREITGADALYVLNEAIA